MAEERDLNLRVTADAAQAKAELESLQKAEQGLVTSSNQAGAATAGSAAAIREQGDAAGEAAGQVEGSSDALSDLGSSATVAGLAQQRLADSMRGSTSAVTAQVTATRTSTAATQADVIAETQQTVATNASAAAARTDAVAETQQAVATRNTTAAAMANALAQTSEAAATKGAASAAAAYVAPAGLMGLSARAAGAAIAGKEISVSKLATSLVKMAAPVLGVVTVIALLPQVIKLVVDKTTEWSKKIGESIAGLDEQADVARKAGESTNDYQKRVHEVANEQAIWNRALDASRKGLIDWSDDVEIAKARYIVYMDSIGKGNFTLKQVEDAYKSLGLAFAKAMSFDEASAGYRTFMQGYQKALGEGENATRRYVEANKDSIEKYMEAFEDAGIAIPKDLQAVATSYDIVTTKQKDAIEVAKAHAEAMKLLTPAAKAAVEASEGLLAAGIASGEAFERAAVNVEAMLNSIQKITDVAPKFVSDAGTIVTGLEAIAAAAAAADRTTNSLFQVPSASAMAAELFEPGEGEPGLLTPPTGRSVY